MGVTLGIGIALILQCGRNAISDSQWSLWRTYIFKETNCGISLRAGTPEGMAEEEDIEKIWDNLHLRWDLKDGFSKSTDVTGFKEGSTVYKLSKM